MRLDASVLYIDNFMRHRFTAGSELIRCAIMVKKCSSIRKEYGETYKTIRIKDLVNVLQQTKAE